MVKTAIGCLVKRKHPVVVLLFGKQPHAFVGHFCEIMCCGKGCTHMATFFLYTLENHSLEESSVVIDIP